jgi:pyruvate/2-oxoglutarate dehydrogenase complex dihydrolipoamide dehydrogenase (E3) component
VSAEGVERFELVVIGGGPAGVTAALRAAELGARVALVERDRPGGTCTDDGCAPTRVLARAARLLRDVEQLPAFGLGGVDAPTVDLAAAMAATQRTVYEIHEKKQLVGHLERAGVHVVRDRGPARFVAPHRLAVGEDAALDAERVVIACGGHARRLGFPGGELALTHGEIWGLREVPRSLAIVGAAATGVQLASIFAAFGSRVTLLELAPRILPAEDAEISTAIADASKANGVQIQAGIGGVDELRRSGDRLQLAYRLGDETVSLDVDAVILAAGWPGNLDGLGLEAAGVETSRGYVAVDDTLRTSVRHIWAAGDVTGRMMLVQSATYEGRVAAENALGHGPRHLRHAIVAHGGFTDPEYASVGIAEPVGANADGDGLVIGRVAYADLDRAVIDRQTRGFCKLVVDRETRRLLGAHAVGEQAVEVIQVATAAMAAEMPVDRLAEVEFAYPTFTSIVALAARQVVHALRLGEQAAAWEAIGRPRVSEWERREA